MFVKLNTKTQITLLDFQETAVKSITETLLTSASVLVQSATGSGKTVIACAYIQSLIKKKKKVLIVVPKQTLVNQFYGTLKLFGITPSVLHDELDRDDEGNPYETDWSNPVQITMPVTFDNTLKGKNSLEFNKSWKPDLIVFDEAHYATSEKFQDIKKYYPKAKILGLTATPYRELNKPGENLEDWYGTRLITTISVKELIKLGRLVKAKYYNGGENEHMVNVWLSKAKGRKTIVFSRSTQDSFEVKKAFELIGIKAEVITAGSECDPDNIVNPQTNLQRQKIYNAFKNGDIDVLISYDALAEGFDCPVAGVCILRRKIGIHSKYHQMIGRVVRAYPGKEFALVLDFGDNVAEHGEIEDYEWSMEEGKQTRMRVTKISIITLTQFNERTFISYTCDCSHIYNIKKYAQCGECGTKHEVTFKLNPEQKLERDFKNVSKDDMDLLNIRFKAANTYPRSRRGFNYIYGFDVWNLDTSKLNSDFEYIQEVFKDGFNLKDNLIYKEYEKQHEYMVSLNKVALQAKAV